MELLGTGSIDWRTRGYEPSLGSSRGDTPESTFVELPDRCSRRRRLAAQLVSLMVASLLPVSPSPLPNGGRLPGVPRDQHGHLRYLQRVLR